MFRVMQLSRFDWIHELMFAFVKGTATLHLSTLHHQTAPLDQCNQHKNCCVVSQILLLAPFTAAVSQPLLV